MKRTSIIGHVFFLLTTVFLVVGLYSVKVSARKAMPKVVKIKAKMGTVTFHHTVHLKRAHYKCITCHHMMKKNPNKMACRACHGKTAKGKVPSAMTAFHTTCRACHKKRHGPTKCKACHKK